MRENLVERRQRHVRLLAAFGEVDVAVGADLGGGEGGLVGCGRFREVGLGDDGG